MPARRRAPKGCRLANFLLPIQSFAVVWAYPIRQQNVKLFLREPLITSVLSALRTRITRIFEIPSVSARTPLPYAWNNSRTTGACTGTR